jgi:EAL domain-containing protein (putative c-di-GMP-specific phosphodiesterase class I)
VTAKPDAKAINRLIEMLSKAQSFPLEPLRRVTATEADVWFLCGSIRPGEPIRHIAIDDHPFIVGRRPGASLSLQYRTVSGNHASLRIDGRRLMLEDLNSTNGTYVNGERVTGAAIPVVEEDLIHFAEAPFRVLRQSPTSENNGTIEENVCDQALALVQFDRLMSQKLVVPHFQPIIKLACGTQIGHEILGRGKVFGLESVGAMFQAAEQLNLEVELSQLLRWEGIRVGREFGSDVALFVNTHPKEMMGDGLIDSLIRVREMAGSQPIILEIHEAAVTRPEMMQELCLRLNDLDIQLAYDDFGSGQARLAELIEARPHVVKFDISLIHGIDAADTHRKKMIETLVQMVRDLDILSLAEGVETAEEAAVCLDLGFDLAQGYHFGRPAPASFDAQYR